MPATKVTVGSDALALWSQCAPRRSTERERESERVSERERERVRGRERERERERVSERERWLGVGMRVHAQTKAPRCDFRRHKTTIAEVAVSRRDENVIVRSLYLLFNPNSSNATHPTTFQYTKYFT